MFRPIKTTICAIAATSLAVAQPAMATRSAESLPAPGAKVTAMAGQRGASSLSQSEQLHGNNTVLVAVVLGVIIGIIILATHGHNHNHSPG